MKPTGTPLLELEAVNSYYGRAHVLFDVSLRVYPREVVVLLGRNGAGKTTTFKSIVGLVNVRGTVRFRDRNITGLAPYQIARLGVGYVPEDRQIFPHLTVAENLEIGMKPGADGSVRWTIDRLETVFPMLSPLLGRLGGNLSGGEQQLVTIARTLMGNPDVVLLDEPTEGIAPVIVKTLATVVRRLGEEGESVLLSEQHVRFALGVSDRAYVIDSGHIRYEGTVEAVRAEPEVMKRYLAV